VPETTTPCPLCLGMGWRVILREGRELAVRCGCRAERKLQWEVQACRVPARYGHCTVEGFELWNPRDPTLRQARTRTQEFIDHFPTVDRGLMYMGKVGTGKTHLAVAALREIVTDKGVSGLYVNFLELVQQLQMTFERNGGSREEILGPVTEADILVLDELGAGKMTEWVRDLLYFVINSRYMTQKVTIFTTNYLDFPQPGKGGGRGGEAPTGPEPGERWQETLADRITDRLRSRLHEMCSVIELRGEDFRARSSARTGRGA